MRRYRRLSVVARALVQHAGTSMVALLIVGASAAVICIRLVQSEALRHAEDSGAAIASRVVAPLFTDAVRIGEPEAVHALDERIRLRMSGDTLQRVKVWAADGTILYCDDHREIGLVFPLEPDDLAMLASGGVDSDISDLAKSENALDRGFGKSLEVYIGARDTRGRPILIETYYAADRLHADEAALIRRIIPVVVVAVLILGLLLVPLAFNLARRVARYERERQAMIRLAVEASSAERRRVAGELHDGVIQDLAGVGYALTALDGQLTGLEESFSTQRVGALRSTLRRAQRLVHDDVLALRDLTGMQYAAASGAADPAAALGVLAEEARAAGLTVDLVLEELPALPATHRAAIIRVGREALRNAVKHAPGSHVLLSLGPEGNAVVVTVSDDGPGFERNSARGPADGHIGLALLADAAEGVGGRLELRSRPGRGTTVTLIVPVPGRSASGERPAVAAEPADRTGQPA
jgi:two-component system, NarL family, sensor kinase